MIVVVIKKKWITGLTILLASMIIVSTLYYLIHSPTIETNHIPSTSKVIIIDPGHGGVDPGAIGKGDVLEKDINLAIGLYLREYLEQSGAIVVLTRDSDKGLYDQSGSIRNKKNQDLKRRKELVKNSRGNIFISIHLNSFQQQQYYGAQAFYPKGSPESKNLAEILQSELRNVLDPNNTRVALQKADMYLIKELDIPSVLVECGFLSNPQELKKLKDPQYQKKIAWALYVGIQRYLGKDIKQ